MLINKYLFCSIILVSVEVSETSSGSPMKLNQTLSDAQSSHDGSFNEPSTSEILDSK